MTSNKKKPNAWTHARMQSQGAGGANARKYCQTLYSCRSGRLQLLLAHLSRESPSQRVGQPSQRCALATVTGLLSRIAFPSQRSLIYKQVVFFENQTVSGNTPTRRQEYDIPWHYLLGRDFGFFSVPHDSGFNLDERQESLHYIRSASFLPEAQKPANYHDGKYDYCINGISKEQG